MPPAAHSKASTGRTETKNSLIINTTALICRFWGFVVLLMSKGWTLSPAYDMNPTLNEYQSLLVSSTSNKAELGILLDACEDYMLNRTTAEKIVVEVTEAIKGWRELATRLGISKREMDMFAGVLDERCKME